MTTIMRYSEEKKHEVRERIISAASRAFRRLGLDGPGIPALMKAAGRTHGAFYAHFEDRDALVAEALRLAGAQLRDRVFGDDRDAALTDAIARYTDASLSKNLEESCPLASNGIEASRGGPAVRAAITDVAKKFLIELERARSGRRDVAPSDETLRLGALLVGSVVLGRILGDPGLPARLLGPRARD